MPDVRLMRRERDRHRFDGRQAATASFYVFVKETSHRVSLLFLFYLFLCLFQSFPQ